MKPADWDQMSREDKIDCGNRLLNGYRGSYLIAQALSVAIQSMRRKPKKEREVSNIEDMEILLETCFSTFGSILELEKQNFRLKYNK